MHEWQGGPGRSLNRPFERSNMTVCVNRKKSGNGTPGFEDGGRLTFSLSVSLCITMSSLLLERKG